MMVVASIFGLFTCIAQAAVLIAQISVRFPAAASVHRYPHGERFMGMSGEMSTCAYECNCCPALSCSCN